MLLLILFAWLGICRIIDKKHLFRVNCDVWRMLLQSLEDTISEKRLHYSVRYSQVTKRAWRSTSTWMARRFICDLRDPRSIRNRAWQTRFSEEKRALPRETFGPARRKINRTIITGDRHEWETYLLSKGIAGRAVQSNFYPTSDSDTECLSRDFLSLHIDTRSIPIPHRDGSIRSERIRVREYVNEKQIHRGVIVPIYKFMDT